MHESKLPVGYAPSNAAPRLSVKALSWGPALSEICDLLGAFIRLCQLCDERGVEGTVTTAEIKAICEKTHLDFASFIIPAAGGSQ